MLLVSIRERHRSLFEGLEAEGDETGVDKQRVVKQHYSLNDEHGCYVVGFASEIRARGIRTHVGRVNTSAERKWPEESLGTEHFPGCLAEL